MSIPVPVLRILDAAANRAGEGFRVIEDFARFALNDSHMSRLLKECRHDLTQLLTQIPMEHRLAARDTLGDVGTEIETATEYTRSSPGDVVQAAFKRVQESLRTLEEYGKLIPTAELSTSFAHRVEQLRYRFYTVEKGLLRTAVARQRLIQQGVYLLLTSSACREGLETIVHAALEGGVRLFQLREKQMADRELLAVARRVREWTRAGDALLLINDRPDIAVLCDADGVHVGQEELTVQDARRIVGAERLVGVSSHCIEQARQGVLDGADYLGVGPTFLSKTKSFQQLAGLDFVRQAHAEITLPWFAIGGIDIENLDQVLAAGAHRVAVSSAICGSATPAITAAELCSRLLATKPD